MFGRRDHKALDGWEIPLIFTIILFPVMEFSSTYCSLLGSIDLLAEQREPLNRFKGLLTEATLLALPLLSALFLSWRTFR